MPTSADTRRLYAPIQPPPIPTWPGCWELGLPGKPPIWCWTCKQGVGEERGIDGSLRRSCACSVQTTTPRR